MLTRKRFVPVKTRKLALTLSLPGLISLIFLLSAGTFNLSLAGTKENNYSSFSNPKQSTNYQNEFQKINLPAKNKSKKADEMPLQKEKIRNRAINNATTSQLDSKNQPKPKHLEKQQKEGQVKGKEKKEEGEEEKDKKEKEKEKKRAHSPPPSFPSIFHPHEEVIVTATMTRKAVKDCAASVTVVTPTEVQAIPASNALNLLNYFPGIFVRRTGDLGRADVDIRGLGDRGRRVAILVDGRPEKMGLFGCIITHAFPLDNVERVEVVKGPASVLYGSEALGGVINIITHRPSLGFETEFLGTYGSFNTHQLNLRHGGGFSRWGYYLTFDHRTSEGHRPNSQYWGNAVTGKFFFNLSTKSKLILNTKYFVGKKYEAGPLDFPLENFWNDYQRGALDLSWHQQDQNSDFLLMIYRNFGHHRFSDGWHSRDFVDGGLLRYTLRVNHHELTAGAEFRRLSGKSYNWPQGEWHKSEGAAFLQDELVIQEKLILSAGLRLHRDSLFGLEICPRGGAVWQINPRFILKGIISKGFRSPQLNELFMFPPANPDLKPERVWNYEGGVELRLDDKTWITGTIFRMKGSNLIENGPNPSPPPAFLFQNVGKFNFHGAEFSFQRRINFLLGRLDYTFLDSGHLTQGRPRHKVDFSLGYLKGKIKNFLTGQYVTCYFAGNNETKPLPSYFLLNNRWRWQVSNHVEIIVDVQNILNTDYQIFVSLPGIGTGPYPMPRRSFQLSLRITQ